MVGEKSQKLRELADKVEEVERLTAEQKEIEESLERKQWLISQPLIGHDDVVKEYAKEFKTSYTKANNLLKNNLEEYVIEGKNIPTIIKDMRMHRRKLKGENRITMSKSIDNLIDAYSDHLDKSIDDIYWLSKYKTQVKEMVCTENDIIKLNNIYAEDTRREIIDVLCKYWESKLEQKGLTYNSEFAKLNKQMTQSKKEFKSIIKNQSSTVGMKNKLKKSILKSVCENPGISARELHEQLPHNLQRKSTPNMISKLATTQNITNVNGAYYKLDDDIKKDIWAYTAAFIDSDGFITIDKNLNPRVGLVATGDRGKAFMLEMHKSLGMGRLHLDQKSPQDTRPVNRLNFYSQGEIHDLLTKCKPHFKLKSKNAETLLELVRIKKGFKSQKWSKNRMRELYKLMKYYNHSDNVNYDFSKYDIDIENIHKLEDNNKMAIMDDLESSGVITKNIRDEEE